MGNHGTGVFFSWSQASDGLKGDTGSHTQTRLLWCASVLGTVHKELLDDQKEVN